MLHCTQEIADTSDVVYEKRHRKYETFEKRQRLREKEKLKHEQYKLKERIEQLRAMDASAFLALPASDFSDPLNVSASITRRQGDAEGGMKSEPQDAHIDASVVMPNEGERRRKEMLEVALALEERYRILLPTDRKWLDKRSTAPESTGTPASVRRESLEPSEDEHEEQNVEALDELPGPVAPTLHDADGESEVDPEERDRQRSKGLKLRIKFPPRTTFTGTSTTTPTPTPSGKQAASTSTMRYKQKTLSPFMVKAASKADSSPSLHSKGRGIANVPGVVIRAADGKFLPKSKRYPTNANVDIDSSDTHTLTPPSKRQRRYSTVSAGAEASISAPVTTTKSSHKHYTSTTSTSTSKTHPERPPAPCMLVLAAERNALAPTARKTQRHVTAFGARVPQEIEEVRDFEIPEWVLESPSSLAAVAAAAKEDEDKRWQRAAEILQDQWGIFNGGAKASDVYGELDEEGEGEGQDEFDYQFSEDSESRNVRDELVLECPSSESLQDSSSRDNLPQET